MGALNPLFLSAAVAIAVPIFLHLFQRHETRRFSFPALRYLERTEREHAREIRFRQLLLLLTRVLILLLLVGAGARLIFGGRSGAHAPTAVVMILDNSLSSGLVEGETRILDELKALAQRTLDGASDEDRFWVIRAGEPWLPAVAGGAAEARRAVGETETSAANGDLTAALERAAGLLRTSELENKEIQLLSDMQRSAFVLPGVSPAGDLPVVTWVARSERPLNRALTGLLVGGGLPPLQGQRTELTVSASVSGTDTTRWPVRLIVDDRIRGAGSVSGGSATAIALSASASGWVQGYVDAEPDALRADDRRYFAYHSRTAPVVSVAGGAGLFLTEALGVLESSGRVRRSTPSEAELLIAQDGEGLDERGPSTAAVVIPPEDATRLPALNRRLVEAGISWRYEPRGATGEADLAGANLPEALRGVRALRWYALVGASEPAPGTRTLAEAAGERWAVEGADLSGRRYLLLGSPVATSSTTLPVSTGMVRFVDWAASDWAGAGNSSEYTCGMRLPAPASATHVYFPSGREVEIDGTRAVRETGEAGFYTFAAADTTVAVVAVNPPAEESDLTTLERNDFGSAIGPDVYTASEPDAWSRAVYRRRVGPELSWPFLLLAGLLLLAESLLASSGRGGEVSVRRRSTTAETSGVLP